MSMTYYPDMFTVFLGTAVLAALIEKEFRQVSVFMFISTSVYYAIHSLKFELSAFQFWEQIAVYFIAGLAWTIPLVFLEMLSWKLEWKSKSLTNWISQEDFSSKYNDNNNSIKVFMPHISLAFKFWNNQLSKEELFAAIDRSANPAFTTEQKESFLRDTAKIIVKKHSYSKGEGEFLDLYEKDGALAVEVNKKSLGLAILFNIFTYPYVLALILWRMIKASIKIIFLKHTRPYLQQIEQASKMSNFKALSETK